MGPIYFTQSITNAIKNLGLENQVENIHFHNHPSYWKDLNPEWAGRDATAPVRMATVDISIMVLDNEVSPEEIIKAVHDTIFSNMEIYSIEYFQKSKQHILSAGEILNVESSDNGQLKIVLHNGTWSA